MLKIAKWTVKVEKVNIQLNFIEVLTLLKNNSNSNSNIIKMKIKNIIFLKRIKIILFNNNNNNNNNSNINKMKIKNIIFLKRIKIIFFNNNKNNKVISNTVFKEIQAQINKWDV